jgi:DNA-binding CsgD family transcriptional regulator
MREIQTVSDGPYFICSKAEKDILESIIAACDEGKFLTNAQIAERAGCTVQHVRNILKKLNLQSACRYMAEVSLPGIFASVISGALKGSNKKQELFFTIIGMIKKEYPSIINIINSDGGERHLTESDIDRMLGK